MRGRLNIIVSGGTGTGKTTTLNVLSSFIPDDERIVTIEDAAELQLQQEHVVRLESRPANIEGKGAVHIRDLVRNCLRMRPDRIIVGEVRDAEALDMLQAMNTGHDGSICTVHANGPRDTLARLETMVLMAGMDLPVRAIREQVASAVDLIVHQTRLQGRLAPHHPHHRGGADGGRRDHPAGHLPLRPLRRLRPRGPATGARCKATGLRPKFLEKMAHANVTVDPMLFATERVSVTPRAARLRPIALGVAALLVARRGRRRTPPTTRPASATSSPTDVPACRSWSSRARGGRRSTSTA